MSLGKKFMDIQDLRGLFIVKDFTINSLSLAFKEYLKLGYYDL